MQHLVVGFDGSESSREALRWALDVTAILRDRDPPVTVDVVRVLRSPPHAALGLPAHVPPSTVAERRREAEEELARAVAAAGASGSQVTVRVIDGDPSQTLLELSRYADLLVLGSSHLGRISGAVLGSVAQQCIAAATTAVVIVPQHDHD